MTSVVTLEELRELKRLRETLPALMAAATGRSNFPPMNQFGGASKRERRVAQERPELVLARIRELENKLGPVR
jgi:hypothetical protein